MFFSFPCLAVPSWRRKLRVQLGFPPTQTVSFLPNPEEVPCEHNLSTIAFINATDLLYGANSLVLTQLPKLRSPQQEPGLRTDTSFFTLDPRMSRVGRDPQGSSSPAPEAPKDHPKIRPHVQAPSPNSFSCSQATDATRSSLARHWGTTSPCQQPPSPRDGSTLTTTPPP